MSRRLVRLRQASQFVFLAAFLALFAAAAYRRGAGVPVDTFLRADPLIALSAMLSLRRILLPLLWFSLPVVVLSLLLGRVFCGWICPLGTAIDLCERALRIRGRRPAKAPAWRRVKFYVLLALLVTMLLPVAHYDVGPRGLRDSVGLAATYVLDPIALLTRTVTWSIFPAVQWATSSTSQTLTGYYYSDYVAKYPLLERALSPFQTEDLAVARPVYFRLGLATLLMFAGIIALGLLANRFWCRNLCPLGALLGYLGRRAPVRLHVSEACNRCMKCVNECKTGAITEDPHVYRGPECIGCYRCLAVCPKEAISLTSGIGDRESGIGGRDDVVRLDRRRVLGAAGVGLAAAVLPKVDWGTKPSSARERRLKVSGERLIRPPGAKPENAFVTGCVRCGECMAVCPTNTLQPALGEGGLEALGTPLLVPRIGPCTQECNACGNVCPARVLEPFTVEEKSYLHLGTASVDRSTCIAWAEGKQCVVCDEACSYDAITQDVADKIGRPVVHRDICVGCGLCEFVCPVEPRGAIRVSSSGDSRHQTRAEQRARWEAAKPERDAAESAPRSPGRQETGGGSPYPG